jgi:hypothetical protein
MSAGNFYTHKPSLNDIENLDNSSWIEILVEASMSNLEDDGGINPTIVFYTPNINNTIFTLDLSPMFATDEDNLQAAKYQAMIQSAIFARAISAKESVLVSEGMCYDEGNRVPCLIFLWYNYETQIEQIRRITVDPDNTRIIIKDHGWTVHDNQD